MASDVSVDDCVDCPINEWVTHHVTSVDRNSSQNATVDDWTDQTWVNQTWDNQTWENQSSSPNTTYTGDADMFAFVVEGVLLTGVGFLGIFMNSIAIVVLLRPVMRGSFHRLLVCLALFDFLYLAMSLPVFGFPGISDWYVDKLMPHLLPWCYGLAHIGRVGSCYLTMSVTIER